MKRLGVFEDGQPGPELTRDVPEDRALVRRAGAAGMVLLRNETVGDSALLPLQTSDVQARCGDRSQRGARQP